MDEREESASTQDIAHSPKAGNLSVERSGKISVIAKTVTILIIIFFILWAITLTFPGSFPRSVTIFQCLVLLLLVILIAVSTIHKYYSLVEPSILFGRQMTILVFLVTIMIGILVLSYIADVHFQEAILKEQRQLQGYVTNAVGGYRVEGDEQIYRLGALICQDMDKHIRTVLAASGPKASKAFVKAIAQRLAERQSAGVNVLFEVVLVLDGDKVDDLDRFKKENKKRIEEYEEYGAKDCIHLFILDTEEQLNFDILIVDDKHVNIGIQSFKDEKKLESAVSFQDQPKVAQDMLSWFDRIVLPKAVKYDTWVEEKKLKQKKALNQ